MLQLETTRSASHGGRELPGLLDRLAGEALYVPALAELSGGCQITIAEHLAAGDTVRLIAAVAGNPDELVRAGLLRRQLVDSLFALAVPPLRERIEDLDVVLPQLLSASASRRGIAPPTVGDIVRVRLRAHQWPGDHAELEQFAERAIALGSLEVAARTLSRSEPRRDWAEACARIRRGQSVELDSVCRHVVRQAERRWIDRVVGDASGDLVAAAGRLGLGVSALNTKLRELGLEVSS
jgi:DNA-binding NtrC family response regulator